MEPMEDSPADRGPRRADAPAGKNIGWIVHAEINAANADHDREKDCEPEEINLQSHRAVVACQKGTKRQVSYGR